MIFSIKQISACLKWDLWHSHIRISHYCSVNIIIIIIIIIITKNYERKVYLWIDL
jgi:hypothetical protein